MYLFLRSISNERRLTLVKSCHINARMRLIMFLAEKTVQLKPSFNGARGAAELVELSRSYVDSFYVLFSLRMK